MTQQIALLLSSFREHRNLDQSYIASKLGISLAEYRNMESGELALSSDKLESLAELYDVPPDCFSVDKLVVFKQADVLFTNCTFSGNTGAGYINHQYNNCETDLLPSSINDEIKSLKKQIQGLIQQNNDLITLILKYLKTHTQ